MSNPSRVTEKPLRRVVIQAPDYGGYIATDVHAAGGYGKDLAAFSEIDDLLKWLRATFGHSLEG